jgi:hypothetical protein
MEAPRLSSPESGVPSSESRSSSLRLWLFRCIRRIDGLGVLSLEDRKEFLQHSALLFGGLLTRHQGWGRRQPYYRYYRSPGLPWSPPRDGRAVTGVEQSAQDPTAALVGRLPPRFSSLDKVLVVHRNRFIAAGKGGGYSARAPHTTPGGGSKGLASR